MDNYIVNFLLEHPDIDSKVKSQIRHFQYQYLTKVSNICPADAVLFEQNISSWSSPCRGDYHRFYHKNPLLNEIEAALEVYRDRSCLWNCCGHHSGPSSKATFINSSGLRPAAALPDRSSSSAIEPSAMASSCGPLRFDPALPRSPESCDEFMKMASSNDRSSKRLQEYQSPHDRSNLDHSEEHLNSKSMADRDIKEFDIFLLSDQRSFQSHLDYISLHLLSINELFRESQLVSVEGQDMLLVPKQENKSAIFINSSQDSGERGKAGSKRSGPHDDAIAEGSMAEEEDRSGKAAAGRSPDEFMKVANKSNLIREFIVENGFTPTLQQANGTAARLSLYQPNLAYEFPKQNPPESSFPSLIQNPIFLKFKEIGRDSFSASVFAALLEGFAQIDIDECFQQKGIHSLLRSSYGRVLRFLEESLLIDLSQYINLAKFESLLDLAHEEILLWLMIAEPYSDEALETAIKKTIAVPSFLKVVSSGMAAFSEILRIVLKRDQTILLFDGCYFENRASLLKSYSANSLYLVRSPDYAASLQANLNLLKEQNKTIDFLFMNFHENILKGRWICRENNVSDVIAQILQSGCAASCLTVVIDHTIGFLNGYEIQALLERFQWEIQSKALHIVILRSHQKFDLFGFDKISAGSYCVYSEDNDLLNRFKSLSYEQIDSVSRQGLAHYFTSATKKLEERRDRIFSNALYVYRNIADDLKFNGKNPDQPTLVVAKEDVQNFSIDVQCPMDLDLFVCDAFAKRGIPLMIRSSFGFNLTTVAFTRFHMLRFSIGMEDRKFLDQFIDAFNDIFLGPLS